MLRRSIPTRCALLLTWAVGLMGCGTDPASDPNNLESIPSAPAVTTTVATVPAASPEVSAPAASSPPAPTADLPDHGPAPELANDTWLNAAAPIRLADLRGKVIMVEFWTYG